MQEINQGLKDMMINLVKDTVPELLEKPAPNVNTDPKPAEFEPIRFGILHLTVKNNPINKDDFPIPVCLTLEEKKYLKRVLLTPSKTTGPINCAEFKALEYDCNKYVLPHEPVYPVSTCNFTVNLDFDLTTLFDVEKNMENIRKQLVADYNAKKAEFDEKIALYKQDEKKFSEEIDIYNKYLIAVVELTESYYPRVFIYKNNIYVLVNKQNFQQKEYAHGNRYTSMIKSPHMYVDCCSEITVSKNNRDDELLVQMFDTQQNGYRYEAVYRLVV